MIETQRFFFFTLVLMRMFGFVFFNPIFGRRNIPAIVKAGLAMVLTVVVYTFTDESLLMPTTTLEYGVLLLKEAAIGYVLGFAISLFLYVIIFAGEFIDMQMGLSMSKIYDPQSNTSISLSATFYNALFLMLFFASGAHLTLLKVILTSAEVVPYGSVVIHSGISQSIIDLFSTCTVMAMRFAFPIFAAELLCEVGVGILMKTIPQINVFVVNIQLKVFLGLMLMLLMFSPMAEYLGKMIGTMLENLGAILAMLG
ncbi:MAG: flagellar biosynthetic protein FliR [Epulopiscium sp.]|nr:flagellar biosynthetic protein FliR [Candidatus Epulonipiscium sp.]